MRRASLVSLLVFSALAVTVTAAEEQRQLDPTKPADAVLIVDALTKQLSLPRDQGIALTVAIETLAKAVAPVAAGPFPPPVIPAKD